MQLPADAARGRDAIDRRGHLTGADAGAWAGELPRHGRDLRNRTSIRAAEAGADDEGEGSGVAARVSLTPETIPVAEEVSR